ncbi:MAG: YdcF family protein [Candidatus Shapirobacteria bacterium]|jgi:uncharacterized SAM-binding protein YcdF (DUF218 family)
MKDYTDDRLAKILWDYNNLQHTLKKSDCILGLGSNDIRVAHRAAELFLSGFAPLIIFSGGYGDLTRQLFSKPEADIFANEAVRLGVPKDKIHIENQSTNTGENIIFTKKLIKEKGLDIKSIISVQKPYMQRRAYATLKKQWPEMEFMVAAPQISYEVYPNETISKNLLINLMVGYTQRIKIYPQKGFQIPQDIPPEVWAAYGELVKRGFTQHLAKE